MKNTKKELKSKLLNEEQQEAVKAMIISSMRNSYISVGTLPGDGFDVAANAIASDVVANVQKALLQSNVYVNAANSSVPLKVIKKKKNARK